MYDEHQAQTELRELQQTVAQLRKQLAQETELCDRQNYCLKALAKDFITKDIDPRTDNLIGEVMTDYRNQRTYNDPE
jgi:DNA gyrase/topoisomerase IV subunit A